MGGGSGAVASAACHEHTFIGRALKDPMGSIGRDLLYSAAIVRYWPYQQGREKLSKKFESVPPSVGSYQVQKHQRDVHTAQVLPQTLVVGVWGNAVVIC